MTFTERYRLSQRIKQVLDEPMHEKTDDPIFSYKKVAHSVEYRLALLFEQLLAERQKKCAPAQKG